MVAVEVYVFTEGRVNGLLMIGIVTRNHDRRGGTDDLPTNDVVQRISTILGLLAELQARVLMFQQYIILRLIIRKVANASVLLGMLISQEELVRGPAVFTAGNVKDRRVVGTPETWMRGVSASGYACFQLFAELQLMLSDS